MTDRAPTLMVAAVQPVTVTGDIESNAEAHARAIRDCSARVIVFPEMSLTGYDMLAPAIDRRSQILRPIVDACRDTGSVALVGAPVELGDARAVGVLEVSGDEVRIAYRKMSLGGPETTAFVAGSTPAVIVVNGWRVGIGICKDTRIDEHIDATLSAGIDVYAAGLIHTPTELGEFDVRALRIALQGGVPVVFAGFAGPTDNGYAQTSGGSAIWDAHGTRLVQAGNLPGEYVVAELSSACTHPWD